MRPARVSARQTRGKSNRGMYRLTRARTRSGPSPLLVVIGAAGAAPEGRNLCRPEGVPERLPCVAGRGRHRHSLELEAKQQARILKWFTPADGVDESLFTVTRDGQPVPYVGPRTTNVRPRPTATTSSSRPARVSATSSTSTSSTTSPKPVATRSPTTSRPTISSARTARRPKPRTPSRPTRSPSRQQAAQRRESRSRLRRHRQHRIPDGNTFTACSAAQNRQRSISPARMRRDMPRTQPPTSESSRRGFRYTTWFGTVTSRPATSTVTSHFTAISAAMQGAGDPFDCKCKQRRLCVCLSGSAIHDLSVRRVLGGAADGTDSQAGTLVHEMSHFDVGADRRPRVRPERCPSLAQSSPAQALDNADSHEYFAENTPAQN